MAISSFFIYPKFFFGMPPEACHSLVIFDIFGYIGASWVCDVSYSSFQWFERCECH